MQGCGVTVALHTHKDRVRWHFPSQQYALAGLVAEYGAAAVRWVRGCSTAACPETDFSASAQAAAADGVAAVVVVLGLHNGYGVCWCVLLCACARVSSFGAWMSSLRVFRCWMSAVLWPVRRYLYERVAYLPIVACCSLNLAAMREHSFCPLTGFVVPSSLVQDSVATQLVARPARASAAAAP